MRILLVFILLALLNVSCKSFSFSKKNFERSTSSLNFFSKKEELTRFVNNLPKSKSCNISLSFREYDKQKNLIFEFDHNNAFLHYTASISKLIILLSVIDQIYNHKFSIDDRVASINPFEEVSSDLTVKEVLEKMIRSSSNFYSGIAQRLLRESNDPRGIQQTIKIANKYGFGKGKFYVGAGYQNGPKNFQGLKYNHEGTSEHISMFYNKLLKNELPLTDYFYEILSQSKIYNRFYRSLIDNDISDSKNIWRKSGSWSGNHTYSDSVMFQSKNAKYFILVLLTQGHTCISMGSKDWFNQLINLSIGER